MKAVSRSQDHVEDISDTVIKDALQSAKLGCYRWNVAERRYDYVSDQHAAHFGLTQKAFLARVDHRAALLSQIHPDDRGKLEAAYAKLRDGAPIEVDYRICGSSDLRRIRESARPIFDDANRITHEISSTLDITDRNDADVKLIEAQKMDSIGKLTGGIAHDFNNLLAIILGNLELLREFPNATDRDEMINDAIGAVSRGRDLTMSMLSFARRAPVDPSSLDLNEIVKEMHSILRRALPAPIAIELNLDTAPTPIFADRSLTESAILNLVINARDAMDGCGTLSIRTQSTTVERVQNGLAPGTYTMLEIADTGSGISADLVDHIFEPFFTTKAIAKNSGLGLSMVKGFVEQIGGGITVSSTPNEGTRFRLYFRAAATFTPPRSTKRAFQALRVVTSMRVLVVEDDKAVRSTLTRQLEAAGLDVEAASDCDTAYQIFVENGPFDAVIADMILPGRKQGTDLVKEMRRVRPDQPVVLLSGSPDERGQGTCADVMLMKPASGPHLVAAIQAAIEKAGKPIIRDRFNGETPRIS